MIVLDTNVISEALRPTPSARVAQWMAAQSSQTLYTTSVTEAEMLYGAAIMPDGRRRAQLSRAVAAIFAEDFAEHVLPFDRSAASAFAAIAASRRKAGRPIAAFDAQIAAIAMSRGAALATRNTEHFADLGLKVIDPWAA